MHARMHMHVPLRQLTNPHSSILNSTSDSTIYPTIKIYSGDRTCTQQQGQGDGQRSSMEADNDG
eukprot:m.128234 g.128234  ORF g.128234 m.128234 type:complete len:64 (+) comp13868_c0_seq1:2443-2634(+)